MDELQLNDRQKRLYAEGIERMEGILNKDLARHVTRRVLEFSGNFDVMESALGALLVGQLMGWRVLTLLHSSRTLKKYQDVLDLDFKSTLPWDPSTDVMPEAGVFARKSHAYVIAQKVGDFWKVVRGQTEELSSASDRKAAGPLPD